MNLNIALAGMGAAAVLVAAPVIAVVAVGEGQGSTHHSTHGSNQGPSTPSSCIELVNGNSNPCNAGTSGERPAPYQTVAAPAAGHGCVVLHRSGRRVCNLQ